MQIEGAFWFIHHHNYPAGWSDIAPFSTRNDSSLPVNTGDESVRVVYDARIYNTNNAPSGYKME